MGKYFVFWNATVDKTQNSTTNGELFPFCFHNNKKPKFQNGERLHQTERRAKVEFKQQQQQQRNRKQNCLPKTTNIWVNGMYAKRKKMAAEGISCGEMPQYQSTFYCCHICVFIRNSFQRILSPFILFDVVYCVLLPTISLS